MHYILHRPSNTVIATTDDLALLVALRIRAMQPSLQAVGRFDPVRARERFEKNFIADNTFKIIQGDQLVGFYVLLVKCDHFWLDHLYIDPNHQSGGIGGDILNNLKKIAGQANKPLRLGALKGSRANNFYLKQGLVKIEQQQWDNIYQWN